MDIIIRTGFESIKHKIHFQPQTEQKGKKLVLAQHVREVEELRTNGKSFLIRARIIRQTSVTQTPYKDVDVDWVLYVTVVVQQPISLVFGVFVVTILEVKENMHLHAGSQLLLATAREGNGRHLASGMVFNCEGPLACSPPRHPTSLNHWASHAQNAPNYKHRLPPPTPKKGRPFSEDC
ncbi:hypothetical protein ACJJTC_006328 [Scirpophaga incertulas]